MSRILHVVDVLKSTDTSCGLCINLVETLDSVNSVNSGIVNSHRNDRWFVATISNY